MAFAVWGADTVLMSGQPLDGLIPRGQWSYATSDPRAGWPVVSLCQMAAVRARMRYRTRTITPDHPASSERLEVSRDRPHSTVAESTTQTSSARAMPQGRRPRWSWNVTQG
jgi:hypothetical protein